MEQIRSSTITEFNQVDVDYLMDTTRSSESCVKQALIDNNHDIIHAWAALSYTEGSDSSMDIDGDSFNRIGDIVDLEPRSLDAEFEFLRSNPIVFAPSPISTQTMRIESPLPFLAEMNSSSVPTPVPTRDGIEADKTTDTKEEEDSCVICLGSFDGTRTTTTKCGHRFHTDCIFGNISSAPSNKHACPLCRTDMFSPITSKKEEDLLEYAQMIEADNEERRERVHHLQSAVLYLYDKCEQQSFDLIETKRDFKVDDKEILALRNALCRSQQKLSSEVVIAGNESRYRKCSQCKCYGHNSRLCMSIGSTFTKERGRGNSLLKFHYAFNTELRSSEEIIESIMPDGELHEEINEHFE